MAHGLEDTPSEKIEKFGRPIALLMIAVLIWTAIDTEHASDFFSQLKAQFQASVPGLVIEACFQPTEIDGTFVCFDAVKPFSRNRD